MSKHFKKIAIAFIAVLLFALNASAKDSGGKASRKIDIDLTRMSSTMVYAQVNQMVTEPVKITIIGDFEMAEDGEDAYPVIRNAKLSNE